MNNHNETKNLLALDLEILETDRTLINTMKALNEYAETIKKAIQTLEAKRDELKSETERIEEHILKQRNLLDDIQPSRIKFKNGNEAPSVSSSNIYSEVQRIGAVRAAIDSISDVPFQRAEVLEIISKKYPDMYRMTPKGKTAFSNDFWRVIRDLKAGNKVIETEKGGGRKATVFRKI